jgi:hypothetical protein
VVLSAPARDRILSVQAQQAWPSRAAWALAAGDIDSLRVVFEYPSFAAAYEGIAFMDAARALPPDQARACLRLQQPSLS